MNWSLKIARLAGINVFVHWTFAFLIGYVIYSQMSQGLTFQESLWAVWFVLSLFACVVLHELGHALTARRYGVETRNIVLLPIGGVANLEKMPEKPVEELLVALAGPAVNVVIAFVLFAGLYFTDSFANVDEEANRITASNFLPALMGVNILLVLFNMIPAFPMDGGRVLRSLLAMRFSRSKATRFSAVLGQVLAVGFVIGGWYLESYMLPFIGLFIFMVAGAESNLEKTREILSNFVVRDVLIKDFSVLHAWERLTNATQLLLERQATSFLVMEDNFLIGTLTKDEILKGIKENDGNTMVKRIANQNIIRLSPEMNLKDAYEKMTQAQITVCPVFEEQELIGIIDRETIIKLMTIQQASHTSGSSANTPVGSD